MSMRRKRSIQGFDEEINWIACNRMMLSTPLQYVIAKLARVCNLLEDFYRSLMCLEWREVCVTKRQVSLLISRVALETRLQLVSVDPAM